MFIFAFAFKYAFTHLDFKRKSIKYEAEKLSFASALFQSTIPFDIFDDTSLLLKKRRRSHTPLSNQVPFFFVCNVFNTV